MTPPLGFASGVAAVRQRAAICGARSRDTSVSSTLVPLRADEPRVTDHADVPAAGLIWMVRVTWAVAPRESVTRNRTVAEPAAVGVPERVPAALSVTPAGRLPLATDQVYGVVPLLAVSVSW